MAAGLWGGREACRSGRNVWGSHGLPVGIGGCMQMEIPFALEPVLTRIKTTRGPRRAGWGERQLRGLIT